MPCECINTAVIMSNENNRLKEKIRLLELKIKKYQYELLDLYNVQKIGMYIKIKKSKSRQR